MTVVSPQSYLFDTSAFVDVGERYYPETVFPGVWREMDSAMKSATIIACKRVLGEVANVNPPLDSWRQRVINGCKPHEVDEASGDIQAVFARLAPLAVKYGPLSSKLSHIDLLVLSTAEAWGLPLVVADGPMRAACKGGYVTVKDLTAAEFFKVMGWSFS